MFEFCRMPALVVCRQQTLCNCFIHKTQQCLIFLSVHVAFHILTADFAAPMYIVLVCCWLVDVCLCVRDYGAFVAQAKHL